MNSEADGDDEQIKAFLQPLRSVTPARRHGSPHRNWVSGTVAAVATITIAGTGVATAAGLFGPLSQDVLRTPAFPLNCEVVGMSGADAVTFVADSNLEIAWRFTTWGGIDSGEESAVASVQGTSTAAVDQPPPESVVYRAIRGSEDGRWYVFTQDPDDPNAPAVRSPDCEAHM